MLAVLSVDFWPPCGISCRGWAHLGSEFQDLRSRGDGFCCFWTGMKQNTWRSWKTAERLRSYRGDQQAERVGKEEWTDCSGACLQ